jgi:NAD(P)H dehydrogenase (quinone)
VTKALIVTAHPDLNSLTHHVAKQLHNALTRQGILNEVADLAAESFDPRFTRDDRSSYQQATPSPVDVLVEQERIDRVGHLVLVFPVYWWSMPALLKGWIDRVFVNGWAFEQPEGSPLKPKLGRLSIHLVPIAGSDAGTYERHGYRASISTQIEHGVIDFCGAKRGSTTYFYDSETKKPSVIVDEVSSLAEDIAMDIALGASRESPRAVSSSKP